MILFSWKWKIESENWETRRNNVGRKADLNWKLRQTDSCNFTSPYNKSMSNFVDDVVSIWALCVVCDNYATTILNHIDMFQERAGTEKNTLYEQIVV